MLRHVSWIALVGITLAGCRPEISYHGDSPTASLADYEIGEPITHGNLTIFTIASKVPLAEDRFITLDEGLKAGTVKVFEMGSGEQPNAAPQLNDAPNPPPNADLPPVLNDNDAADESNDPREVAARPPVVETDTPEEQVADDDPFSDGDSDVDQYLVQPNNASGQWQQVEDLDQVRQSANLDLQFNQGNLNLPFSQGGGREVNRLMVVNTSDKPLYLMPGEVIIGGSQDRTIGQELVIAPNSEPVAVDVFCVEHERWNDRVVRETVAELQTASQGALGGSIAVAGDADANDAAQEIADGKFIASVGNLNKGARLALQKSGEQGQVWDEVALQNGKSKVAAGGATFTANYSNAEFNQQLNPYVEALHDSVAEHKNIVGVIVAVDGKVESMDMFESTPLFKKLWPKLLKSYALDAATQRVDGEAASGEADESRTLTVADAKTFFTKATRGEITKTDRSGDLAATTRESDDVICFSLRSAEARAGAAAAADASEEFSGYGGGLGGGVHTSAFAH